MGVPGAVTDTSRVDAETIRFASGNDTLDGYLARPAGSGRFPGVIVIHEAFGLNEHIRDITRRFANLGYVALAPDLYSRNGAPDADDRPAVHAAMFGLTDAQVVRDLEEAAAHIRASGMGTGKVGCIGFCSGGRQTLLFALSSSKVDAAAACWGGYLRRATPDAEVTPERPTKVIDLAANLACPLYVAIGAEDTNPSPEDAEELRRRLEQAGKKDVTIRVYEGAGHAFLADYRPTYREAAAFELWPELVAFFGRHLGR